MEIYDGFDSVKNIEKSEELLQLVGNQNVRFFQQKNRYHGILRIIIP